MDYIRQASRADLREKHGLRAARMRSIEVPVLFIPGHAGVSVKIPKDHRHGLAKSALEELDLAFSLSIDLRCRNSAGCLLSPCRLPFPAMRIGQRADGDDAVPAAAVQQNDAGVVQISQFSTAAVNMPENRPVECLVQHAPDDDARMVAIAPA